MAASHYLWIYTITTARSHVGDVHSYICPKGTAISLSNFVKILSMNLLNNLLTFVALRTFLRLTYYLSPKPVTPLFKTIPRSVFYLNEFLYILKDSISFKGSRIPAWTRICWKLNIKECSLHLRIPNWKSFPKLSGIITA